MGIEVDFVDFNDDEAVRGKMISDKGKTKLLWLKTPTNSTLKVTDIGKVAKMAKKFSANTHLAVDNTFYSPYFQNPLEHGADIVVHSVTKYINGHSDVVMGGELLRILRYYFTPCNYLTSFVPILIHVIMANTIVVCCNDEEVYKQLRFTQNGVGAVPSPFDCYLAHRGLKTLHLRMEAAARYVKRKIDGSCFFLIRVSGLCAQFYMLSDCAA